METELAKLDAALEAEELAARLEAEYPDASEEQRELMQTSIENTKRLAELKNRLEQLKQRVERQRELKRNAIRYLLKKPVVENKIRLAKMADKNGVATDEEKQLLAKAAEAADDQATDLDALAASLDN